jgi:hypothetical protein
MHVDRLASVLRLRTPSANVRSQWSWYLLWTLPIEAIHFALEILIESKVHCGPIPVPSSEIVRDANTPRSLLGMVTWSILPASIRPELFRGSLGMTSALCRLLRGAEIQSLPDRSRLSYPPSLGRPCRYPVRWSKPPSWPTQKPYRKRDGSIPSPDAAALAGVLGKVAALPSPAG